MLRKMVIHLFVLFGLVLGLAGAPGTAGSSARAAGGSTAELKKLDKEIDNFLTVKKKHKKKKHHKKKKGGKKKGGKKKHHKKHHKKKKKTTASLDELKKLDKEIDGFLAGSKK